MPDSRTCADALRFLARYAIEIPAAARAGLESGTFETPKPGDARFSGHQVHMIAIPQQSLEAAELARTAGIGVHVLSDEMEGESREVGKVHAAMACYSARRRCGDKIGGNARLQAHVRMRDVLHPGADRGSVVERSI